MMEGVNSEGKRVSLLNDASDDAAYHHARCAKPVAASMQLPVPLQAHQRQQQHLSSRPAPTLSAVRPGPRPVVHPSYSRTSISTTTSSTTTSYNIAPYHSDSESSLSRHSSIASPKYSPALRAVPQLSRNDSSSSAQSPSSPSLPMTPSYIPTFVEPLDPQGKSISIDPSVYSFATQPLPSHVSNGLVAGAMSAAPATNAPYYPSPAQGALPVSASQTNLFSSFPNLNQAGFDDMYGIAPQVQYQFATNLIEPLPVAPALGTASLASPTSLAAVADPALPPVDSSSAPASSNGGNGNNAAAGAITKAKKKYPCPHAAKFNCHDTFTTSGHAARHGKKHTGEKNILCPTCKKAFTRKDNMKQHERTHKSNRNIDGTDSAKSGASTGHSRRTQSISSVAASTVTHNSSNSIDMELDSPVVDVFDSKRSSFQRPSLARLGQYSGSSSTGSADFKVDALPRPELSRQFSGESQDGEGESPGLDALAMAATSEFSR